MLSSWATGSASVVEEIPFVFVFVRIILVASVFSLDDNVEGDQLSNKCTMNYITSFPPVANFSLLIHLDVLKRMYCITILQNEIYFIGNANVNYLIRLPELED